MKLSVSNIIELQGLDHHAAIAFSAALGERMKDPDTTLTSEDYRAVMIEIEHMMAKALSEKDTTPPFGWESNWKKRCDALAKVREDVHSLFLHLSAWGVADIPPEVQDSMVAPQ